MKLSITSVRISAVFALIFAIATAAAFAGQQGANHAKKDIVDIATSAGSFNTLIEAVKAAGLVETLKGEGPFTVFAPTDEAFAQIPSEDLQALLADKEALTKLLTYHVLPTKLMSGQARTVSSAKTVSGDIVRIIGSYSYGNGIKIDNANVLQADIVAANGVIHVIDRVIIPKS